MEFTLNVVNVFEMTKKRRSELKLMTLTIKRYEDNHSVPLPRWEGLGEGDALFHPPLKPPPSRGGTEGTEWLRSNVSSSESKISILLKMAFPIISDILLRLPVADSSRSGILRNF